MSGTATISQNAARVRGPIAKIRVEGSPGALMRAQLFVASRPMPIESILADPLSNRLRSTGLVVLCGIGLMPVHSTMGATFVVSAIELPRGLNVTRAALSQRSTD